MSGSARTRYREKLAEHVYRDVVAPRPKLWVVRLPVHDGHDVAVDPYTGRVHHAVTLSLFYVMDNQCHLEHGRPLKEMADVEFVDDYEVHIPLRDDYAPIDLEGDGHLPGPDDMLFPELRLRP